MILFSKFLNKIVINMLGYITHSLSHVSSIFRSAPVYVYNENLKDSLTWLYILLTYKVKKNTALK